MCVCVYVCACGILHIMYLLLDVYRNLDSEHYNDYGPMATKLCLVLYPLALCMYALFGLYTICLVKSLLDYC